MKVWNELSGKPIPLLEKEGWMRGPKISRSHLNPRRRARRASAIARSINSGQTGEIIRPERFGRTDHPVCGNSVASRYLIYAAATPPFQGGECGLIPIDSHGLSMTAPTEASGDFSKGLLEKEGNVTRGDRPKAIMKGDICVF
jgi:hypothetical protein